MTHTEDSTTAERFAAFHAKSPEVYRTLVELARQWTQSTGRNRLGIATLYERARWELAITTSDPDFKLNNSYRAYYARLIMAQEPDLRGLFALRKSQADAWGTGPRLATALDLHASGKAPEPKADEYDPGWLQAFLRGDQS